MLSETYLVDGKILSREECIQAFKHYILSEREKRCLELIEKNAETILDLGCYSGAFAKNLVSQFPNKKIIAADYDEENLKIAKLLHPEIESIFQKHSAYQIGLESRTLDCVLFQEVIEHLEGAAVAIKEINRVLKINGTFILSTPTPYYWKDMLFHFKYEILRHVFTKRIPLSDVIYHQEHEWNRHIYCWTPTTLLTLLKVNGFEYVTHTFGQDSQSLFEKYLLKCFPFLSPTFILKVKKVSDANERLV